MCITRQRLRAACSGLATAAWCGLACASLLLLGSALSVLAVVGLGSRLRAGFVYYVRFAPVAAGLVSPITTCSCCSLVVWRPGWAQQLQGVVCPAPVPQPLMFCAASLHGPLASFSSLEELSHWVFPLPARMCARSLLLPRLLPGGLQFFACVLPPRGVFGWMGIGCVLEKWLPANATKSVACEICRTIAARAQKSAGTVENERKATYF